MQKNLKVSILGKDYAIATDEGENSVQQAAELVDALMSQYAQRFPRAGEGKIAVVVALELASKLAQKDNDLAALQKRVAALNTIIDTTP
ncbi:MAG: hypothetical protein US69_C0005G0029 [candidate division TM6 bacterium GW2011_GWF2_38_10]|nr:MAG: hypothetical protein US69_C0005G0029 [candidate division TM6 bacterium GW2011_GWF2_38_10]